MSEQAQIIYTIEGIPHNLKALFKKFVSNFIQKDFWDKGTKYQIMDIGPTEGFSTTFQLHPSGAGQIKFKISFVENPSSIDITYSKSFKVMTPSGFMGKMMRKMMDSQKDYIDKGLDLQMIPLITNCIRETISELEEKEEQIKEETKSEGAQDPLQILKIQFAKGEISEEEYLRKKKILEE